MTKHTKAFQPIGTKNQKNKQTPEVEIPQETLTQKPKKWIWIVIYLLLFIAGVIGVCAYKMWFSK